MKSLWLAPPKGEPIAVAKTPTIVGRDVAADIVVAHSSVSRRHAQVERSGEEWEVVDQKSANGTWIDGQRVIRARLKAGQTLRFGAVPFTVAFERTVAPAPPVQPALVQPVAPPPAAATPGISQAAELLGVQPGAPRDEVRRRYQKVYNDYQIRLTNAPTASLKRMYQKSLQELKAAAELLAPGVLDE